MKRRPRKGPKWPAPGPPSRRQHETADGRPKRSFASERAAFEFTFQHPEVSGQRPYRCEICGRYHLASGAD